MAVAVPVMVAADAKEALAKAMEVLAALRDGVGGINVVAWLKWLRQWPTINIEDMEQEFELALEEGAKKISGRVQPKRVGQPAAARGPGQIRIRRLGPEPKAA